MHQTYELVINNVNEKKLLLSLHVLPRSCAVHGKMFYAVTNHRRRQNTVLTIPVGCNWDLRYSLEATQQWIDDCSVQLFVPLFFETEREKVLKGQNVKVIPNQ